MDIKNLKGSISVSDFADGLLKQKRHETFGKVWEDYVDCNHCCFKEKCEAICNQVEAELDVNAYCSQVIDYLLGDLTFEDFIKER